MAFPKIIFLQERGNHKVKKVLVVLFQNLRFYKTLKFKMVSNSDLCFMQCKIWGVGKFHHKAILYIVSIYKIYACDLLRRSVFLPPLFSRFGLPNPLFEKPCQLIFSSEDFALTAFSRICILSSCSLMAFSILALLSP